MDTCEGVWMDAARFGWKAATLAAEQGDHTQVIAYRLTALASIALAIAAWCAALYDRSHWWRR